MKRERITHDDVRRPGTRIVLSGSRALSLELHNGGIALNLHDKDRGCLGGILLGRGPSTVLAKILRDLLRDTHDDD